LFKGFILLAEPHGFLNKFEPFPNGNAMNWKSFFDPVNLEEFKTGEWQHPSIGASIQTHSADHFPNIGRNQLALIGITDHSNEKALKGIRHCFYELKQLRDFPQFLDLGNYHFNREGDASIKGLAYVLSELMDEGCLPLLFGGTQEVAYAQYMAFCYLRRMTNLVSLDARIDFSSQQQAGLQPETYLQHLLTHDPTYLFNLSILGYQSFLVDEDALAMMEKLYFDTFRLGKVRENMKNIEPVVRQANLMSIDMSSIRQADAPAATHPSPNGFYAEEACLLSRYAGLSGKMESLGVHEIEAEMDQRGQTMHLAAQMMWYFAEGYANRNMESPIEDAEDFFKYITNLKSHAYQIIFYKSKMTDRWWMEVPIDTDNPTLESQKIIPCAYDDYVAASNDEIPDRWWHALQKLSG